MSNYIELLKELEKSYSLESIPVFRNKKKKDYNFNDMEIFFLKLVNRFRKNGKNYNESYKTDLKFVMSLSKYLIDNKHEKQEKIQSFLNRHAKTTEEILKCIAIYEVTAFDKYSQEYFNVPNINELLKLDLKNYLVNKSLIEIYEQIYISDTIKNNISSLLPDNPKYIYSDTRKMNRQFILHVGNTNTGKTYEALECLKKARTGVYLGPLRLLAMEIQDKLMADNVLCSLLTGEEEDIVEGANHISSTVEKANFQKIYDVCVIDECQMISDSQRGGSWTGAILGIKAKEIHLCLAPEGLEIIEKILKDCKDKYTVVKHERKVPLIYEDFIGYNLIKNIREGDALIVFSKKQVLELSSELESNGISTSVIYGALPYNTRKQQVKRFIDKETKVIISTDAIGMGLNLPVHRIIFMNDEKFDGVEMRPLLISEIKQIAGRAGRYGLYNEGYVSAVGQCKHLISTGINTMTPIVKQAYLGFSEKLLIINRDLLDILKVWQDIKTSYLFYEKQDISNTIELLTSLKKYIKNLNSKVIDIDNVSRKTLYDLITVTFDEKNENVKYIWLEYCKMYLSKVSISKPEYPEEVNLSSLETYYKELDLYYSFGIKMQTEIDKDWVRKTKERIALEINDILINNSDQYQKKCKYCGRVLPFSHKFSMCEKCHDRYFG